MISNGWMPIDEAPGEQWVLVSAPKPDCDGIRFFVARKEVWEHEGESGHSWEGPYADFYLCQLDFEPTHFMPLPDPPTT